MSGSLIKIDEEIVTSAVASVTLTGIDSTYDVYMVSYVGLRASTGADVNIRVTKSGTAQSDSEYDRAYKQLRSDTTFGNSSATNQTSIQIGYSGGNNETYENNNTLYLFNFPTAEYSFMTIESVRSDPSAPTIVGDTGGGVHTVGSASDGVSILLSSGNITAGQFVLYGLKKA